MKNVLPRNKQLSLLAFAIVASAMIFSGACMKEPDTTIVNGARPAPQLPATPYVYFDGGTRLPELGRVLFYDKALSLNNTTSCGSCHKQQYAFGDNKPFSRGLFNGYTARNSMALVNTGTSFFSDRNLFWDGRATTTDMAVFMPVMNDVEMHVFDLNILLQKLSTIGYYPQLFEQAFGTSEITVARIRTALTSFVSNLYSHNSKYDSGLLSAAELQGKALFEGKARCYSCHNGSDFNGYSATFRNIGLDVNYADIGRGKITNLETDKGVFLVPTLRNIAYSAPYMHDGRYNTLREVIDHYDHGIQDSRNLSWFLRDIPDNVLDTVNVFDPEQVNTMFTGYPVTRLNLSEQEKVALEAFLRSLSDPEFLTDPKLSDPFH